MNTESNEVNVETFVAMACWVVMWMAGVVLAKGFWSTLFAICTFGWYSLYLVVERVMLVAGVL